MKKKIGIIAVSCALALGMCGVAACTPSESSSGSDGSSAESSEDSLIQMHEDMGNDISDITEVSVENCTNDDCHGGSYDEIVAATEDMWEGVGQIGEANPHDAHGTNGYVCEDCHSLTGTSINQCNGCHDFESPEGWEDKDSTTTVDGLVVDEPLY